MDNLRNQEKNLLNINEVAKLFGVHPETVRRWDKSGKLKSIRIGNFGHRKYKKADIDNLLRPSQNN